MTRTEEFDILSRGVEQALNRFYAEQADLYTLGVNEMCLVGHFCRFFREAVEEAFAEDPALRIDLEYDRQGKDKNPKRAWVDGRYAKLRPDMVVHRRGDSSRNVCLFEFKRSDREKGMARDVRKIRAMVAPDEYSYHFGCQIEFAETRDACRVRWFREGEGRQENTSIKRRRRSTEKAC